METLAELEAQRADLDRRIAAERARQREVWNDGLSDIEAAVRAYAESAGIMVTESQRKSMTTLDLGGLVIVQLGYEEGEWGRWLSVEAANGVTAVFGHNGNPVPPSPAVVTLARELLLAQATANTRGGLDYGPPPFAPDPGPGTGNG
jgi:hypothetical protein